MNASNQFWNPGVTSPFVQKFSENLGLFLSHERKYLDQYTDSNLALASDELLDIMKSQSDMMSSRRTGRDPYWI